MTKKLSELKNRASWSWGHSWPRPARLQVNQSGLDVHQQILQTWIYLCFHAKNIRVCVCLQNWGVCWSLWGLSWSPSARPRRPGWFALCWTSFLTWRQQQGRRLSCVLNALSGPRLRREPSYDRLWRWGGLQHLTCDPTLWNVAVI